MLTVFVEGLEFYAYHGVPAEERVIGHRYRVDVEYEIEAAARETDRIEDTVDYAAVARHLEKTAQESTFLTLERLGETMLEKLFETFPKIQFAKLRLLKRLPPAPIIAEAVGVIITRRRNPPPS